MNPSEIREHILAERDRMRSLLDEAGRLASAVREGVGDYPELHQIARRLDEELAELFDVEEEILRAALRELDAWGDVRATRLEVYLSAQRMAVRQTFLEVSEGLLPARRAAEELAELVDAIFAGFAESEEHFLDADLLRDDLISIRQSGG